MSLYLVSVSIASYLNVFTEVVIRVDVHTIKSSDGIKCKNEIDRFRVHAFLPAEPVVA